MTADLFLFHYETLVLVLAEATKLYSETDSVFASNLFSTGSLWEL